MLGSFVAMEFPLVDGKRDYITAKVFVESQGANVYDGNPMAGIVVIVAYRPKPGRESELLEIVRNRVPTLRKEDLVTDRVPVLMRAKDGTIIEVSEWKSHEAIEAAHRNPRVLAMWDKFFAVCDCVPLKTVPEAETMFAGFEPIPTPPAEGMPTTEPLR